MQKERRALPAEMLLPGSTEKGAPSLYGRDAPFLLSKKQLKADPLRKPVRCETLFDGGDLVVLCFDCFFED